MDRRDLALFGGDPLRKAAYPAWPYLAPGDLERVRVVLESPNWGGSSAAVSDFEELFAQFHDARFGIAVCSGTMALELALHALGIGPGDEVIVPAHSFVATATAVSRVGAEPVFVDIDEGSYNLDASKAAEAVSARTRAMIPVHFGGLVADMDQFADIAAERDLTLIEDAAHAHGAEWYGTRAGGLGTASAFSFQNSKVMTSGEGGILITNDENLAGLARSIANAGRLPQRGWFDHFNLGTNLRLSGLQAALLLGQLERLPEQIRLRAANFAKFREQLGEVPGFTLQQGPEGATVQTRYIVPGRIEEERFGVSRDDFVKAVQAEGVPVRPFYPHPLYANAVFRNRPHRTQQCPVAEQASQDSFWLPMNLFMGSEQDALEAAQAIAKVHRAFQTPPRKVTNGSPVE